MKPEKYENGDKKEDGGYNRKNNTKQDVETVSREEVKFFVAGFELLLRAAEDGLLLN